MREDSVLHASTIEFGNIKYINFASNDYLGLSKDKSIMKAAQDAVEHYGFGAGASRLLSGGTDLHRRLETVITEFKHTRAALVFNSGYAANTSAIPALTSERDVIFSDELNHASLIDGCRLSKAKKIVFRHRDVNHLSELLKGQHAEKRMIVTDTVFSMDGDIAPLHDLYSLCRQHGMLLYLDDAHGTGVLGNGRGALSHFSIEPEPWIIQMGTFSKALGSFGAFITGDPEITAWLINTARGLIYSTALPPCVVAASICSMQCLMQDQSLILQLWSNREKLFSGLKELGFNTLTSETPILPVAPPYPELQRQLRSQSQEIEATLRLSELLQENRIYAPAIRPPTVTTPRIRLAVSAVHTDADIETLLSAMKSLSAVRNL